MGDYVDVAGLKTYYDKAGDSGDPLLLLHGGLVSNESWGMQMLPFAESFRVFANERRAHGRTPDVEGPLRYEDMASDTITFIETVIGEPAHLVGWSDGGNVGLLVAIERPDLVRKLVVIGSNYDTSGLVSMEVPDPYAPEMMMMRSMYEANSPDGPEHWPIAFGKLMAMWEDFHISEDKLGTLAAPTLVMVGDDDMVTLEHTIALYRAMPNSDLAVIPHASHMLPLERADLLNRIVLDFLQSEPPATFAPIRRAT